jgi:hypothetical protein
MSDTNDLNNLPFVMTNWHAPLPDPRGASFNYKTGQYDYVDLGNLTDEQLMAYMPQDISVQQIFQIHRKLGLSSLEAMIKALMAYLGKTE